MSDTKTINKILSRVGTKLNDFFEHDDDQGLLTGSCGSALFYAYYYKLTGKKTYLDRVCYIIERTIKALADKQLIYSHCSGISGIAWCIRHLINNQFIEQNEPDIFEEVDEVLFNYMKDELSEHRYDFLHQGLGITLYFLEKLPDAIAQHYLEEAVLQLENAIVVNDSGISWKDTFTLRNEVNNPSTSYNVGLAHGVPATLSILSMIYEKGIAIKKTLPLIEKGVQWLLSTRNEPDTDCISLYPTGVTAKNEAIGQKQSRLGWCYGDLSIGITLLNIGRRLQNEFYKQEAYDIFKHTLKHRNKENGGINDASLCHGSMGVSHIFRRVYKSTGDTIFLEGAENWLEQTLQISPWKYGLADFKYFTRNGYENNYTLLEGITGIGLALLAALDTNTAPAWDRCLLLS